MELTASLRLRDQTLSRGWVAGTVSRTVRTRTLDLSTRTGSSHNFRGSVMWACIIWKVALPYLEQPWSAFAPTMEDCVNLKRWYYNSGREWSFHALCMRNKYNMVGKRWMQVWISTISSHRNVCFAEGYKLTSRRFMTVVTHLILDQAYS